MTEGQRSHLDFKNDSAEVDILRRWLAGLEHDRGTRATLRRCRSPGEVELMPEFHRLWWQIKPLATKAYPQSLAAVVGLVSQLKADTGPKITLAAQMGRPLDRDRATLSGLRFRRLLAITERDDLYTAMTRVLRHLDGQANLADLAQGVYGWNDYVRKQWAYAYYEVAPNKEA
ncbi:MAG: type I-E CRISPR-associated protein Cse2/CasB [Magnetococcales bacterium]|nr:type I-E CRISPR-associated protein Cse2/CasB [Magnetococcales bacterium]